MSKSEIYFRELQSLLKKERDADLSQHKEFIEKLPLDHKKKKGYTWYPLQLIKKGFTYGDRAYVIVERTSLLDEPHQMKAGHTVRLFSMQPAVRDGDQHAVVHYVDKNRMKVILNSKDLPDWIDLGQIGVELMFDERTYQEMEAALKTLLKPGEGRLKELVQILIGERPAAFRPAEITLSEENSSLNDSQLEAVMHILEAQDLAIIHGPPGTGKTTTLVQAVTVLAKVKPGILVTAPSNTAVDLLTERLVESGVRVVRIGNISRVDEKIVENTLDVLLSAHPETKNIRKIRIQAAESRKAASRYKRNFGYEEREERKRLIREAKEMSAWAGQLEDRLIQQILESAEVITCTLVGAAHPLLDGFHFHTAFVDEAAQALEPANWIPVLKCDKVVLTGDPFQLPPTVKSQEAAKEGLSRTLMEKCLEREALSSMLTLQYRMNEAIMAFSNSWFYGNRLQAAEEVKNHRLQASDNQPLVFIDTAGCGFEEETKQPQQSKFNKGECHILYEHLHSMYGEFPPELIPEIAIISPYMEQVLFIREFLEETELGSILPVTVSTIDGFQGQERDVVYISLVRSNERGKIGFLDDIRRMNVAMTRARKQLVVIGDSATIGQHSFYKAFLEHCESHDAYRTAWEYMSY
jgi:ATP-dependent RNA/DNA helicase IGHMBP2